MDFGSAAPNIHIPLHVKPVQSKKGSVTETKVKVMIILKRHKSVICRFVCE